MKKLLLLLVAAGSALLLYTHSPAIIPHSGPAQVAAAVADNAAIEQAFSARTSKLQVTGEGTVVKLLPDDYRGRRHQRFIVQISPDLTLLVSHNIDLATRINSLQEGDSITFHGEYEWNPKGGVVHWTHHDPKGKHPDGWIRYAGKTYQ